MYLSYKGKSIHFCGVDEALDIFPIASQILFEEGIQACMHYLEAVPWTWQQSLRISYLRTWVPVMACHICNMFSSSNNCYDGSQRFVEGVTKVVGTLPPDDQKALFMFWTNSLQGFRDTEKTSCQWWIDARWLAVSGLQ
ncbi:hypothetical protein SUGI_0692200 [Cryptomeria japonica]|nr:hypothetical protein SUGI_0692200 [Cryptomeria japonica]